jgi:CHAT domain-containing protein/tetratricopeptide (TPR) repeat protein
MFGKIWRWLKKLWQQLFTKPPQNPQLRSDAEQESLFLQLLDMVAKGESRENIKRFLIGNRIDEAELVAWLRRFGSNLLESPETHRELARRMVQLGEVLGGELGKVAREIGRELLGNSETRFLEETGFLTPVPEIDQKSTSNSYFIAPSQQGIQNSEPSLGVLLKAVVLIRQGSDQYEAGNFNEALMSFNQMIEIQPNSYHVWYLKGSTLQKLEHYEEAINCFNQALIIEPNCDEAWNNKGICLKTLGNYEEALTCYNHALNIQPNNAAAWSNKGEVLRNLGCYKEALTCFDKSLAIEANPYAWNGKGATFEELMRDEEALAAYNRALKITHHQNWQAWANRGWAIYYLHGYEAALHNWDEALQSFQPETRDDQEGCASLHWQKGNAHYDYGKPLGLTCPDYWHKSRNSYITALKTLSGSQTSILGEVLGEQVSPRFQLQYLEILQDLTKVCNALNRQDDFQLCLDIGDTMLENLLLETESEERKIQLANKFATFSQLRVVLLAQSLQLKEALLLAEKRKNLCLRWLRESRYVGIREETPLQYPEIEQILSPGIAAIYWHYSPAAITTFIIKLDLDPPNPPYQGGLREIDASSQGVLKEIDSPSQGGLREIDASSQEELNNSYPPLGKGGKGGSQIQIHSAENTPNNPAPNVFDSPSQEELNNSYPPLGKGGKGGSQIQIHSVENTPDNPAATVKQLEKFEDWLKEWKEEYQLNRTRRKPSRRVDAKGAKEETETWRDKMADRLDDLGNILDIEPILKKIGDEITHLILIPHRDLHLLPLHYLFREKGFTITYLPSLKVGIELQNRQYNNSPAQLLSIEHPETQEPLLFAEIDAALIANFYSHPTPTRISGADATKNKVVAAMKNGADIFHFTGHGEHDLNSPINSALALTDERLTLREIFDLPLPNYYLVCLSACETGLTNKSNLIDEFVGLVSGFLAKGTAYVLSTLWSVREDAAALMVVEFYRRLKAGTTPPIAFQEAQNWLRVVTYPQIAEWYRQLATDELCQQDYGCWQNLRSLARNIEKDVDKMELNQPPYQNPYYWAGFTITGKV